MLAVESDAAEPAEMANSAFAADQQLLIGLSSQRWWDVQNALSQLEDLLPDRTQPERSALPLWESLGAA